MTQDASTRLHLVTDNHVAPVAPAGAERVDERRTHDEPAAGTVMADLLRRAEELDARVAAETGSRSSLRPAAMVATGAGLTVLLVLLARQPWPLPGRSAGGVTDVPQSLVTFLLLCTALCVWAAGRATRPAQVLGAAAARLWWALLAGAALVTVAADLSLASFAGTGQRPTDTLVRCLVPIVPAVLAGVLASRAGRAARVRLALGTGLVTVPLAAVGWALLSSSPAATADVTDVLAMTGVAAAAPLAVAVAFVAADRRGRSAH